jgi:hypothetical protein
MDMGMSMTHYMQLLAENQPWNLIIFMAIPVILAEMIVVTELLILSRRDFTGWLRKLNRVAGIAVGLYFAVIFVYLLINAAIPLTTSGSWRGPVDVVAVGFYLLGIVPLLGITLLELGMIGRKRDEQGKVRLHAALIATFLVTAHIAMVFGMLNPSVLGGSTMAMVH